jgi:alpha-ketoglutarate-dependent taurine dioxygenase
MIEIEPTGQACGAFVTGVDFREQQDAATIATLRAAWMKHHVLVFANQKLDDKQLERFAEYFGPIGDDPYIEAMDGKQRIAAIQRRADETGRIFADVWHADWSFQDVPPAGTCLLGVVIPPAGGDTLYSNQHKAWEEMPVELRQKLEGHMAVHSARSAYGDDGFYADQSRKGGMAIVTSEDARDTQDHPMIEAHPETGRMGVRGGSYVVGLDSMNDDDTKETLKELYRWQSRPEFVYTHKWQPNMLVIWDNRSVLHKATGGFEGHDRLLHRLTIRDDSAYYC